MWSEKCNPEDNIWAKTWRRKSKQSCRHLGEVFRQREYQIQGPGEERSLENLRSSTESNVGKEEMIWRSFNNIIKLPAIKVAGNKILDFKADQVRRKNKKDFQWPHFRDEKAKAQRPHGRFVRSLLSDFGRVKVNYF